MRMMLKVTMATDAGNKAIVENKLPQIVGKFVESYKPESTYFTSENGQRCALFFFEMNDASQMPSICEPFFMGLNAKIELNPAMNLADMQAGVAKAMGHHA